MAELALPGLVPLWRTLREQEVTALITPALDYVGGLELATTDVQLLAEDKAEALGEGVRGLVSTLDDDSTLLFLYRVHDEIEDDVRDYEGVAAAATHPALQAHVAARAAWLRSLKLRRTRLFLFFSPSGGKWSSSFGRGQLGLKLVFAPAAQKLARDEHEKRLGALAQLRDRLVNGLSQRAGIQARELSPEDIYRLHYELLNPTRAASAGQRKREVTVRDDLWSDEVIRKHGDHLREYSEAEQLCFEHIEDQRGYFQHGDVLRRVVTLKVLPESGTPYFASHPLLSLTVAGPDGQPEPFAYTLAVAVQIQRQGIARWKLSTQHGMVEALRNSLPFLRGHNLAHEAEAGAKQSSISRLFTEELTQMSSKLVNLSVSLLLEAKTPPALDAQTEAARSAFSAAGNSELLLEDVTQVPAFLSMLPGSGPYQLRRKACTSRNAADFLPLYGAWRGSRRAMSVLSTPQGDAFRFDLFDKRLATAHHGLVVADTGSGKSLSLGLLTLDALAAGLDAILIDNGNSWKPLTQLMGGIHIPVDLRTSISPFVAYEHMLDKGTELGADEIEEVVNFLDVCVTDDGERGFGLLAKDVVSHSVRRLYEALRERPAEKPLISNFRDALATFEGTADDKTIAQQIARRLNIYCEGQYGAFLNRPSELNFDSRLLTFDLQDVAKNPTTKKIAVATIMQAIANRAAARRNRTLVEADEAHEHLTDEVGARFFEGCYRKMRKYDVAMWMISQRFADFVNSKSGEAIIGNSKIRLFLRHDGGHDQVVNYFRLSPAADAAFRGLSLRPGHYSDVFLMYGQMQTTLRLAPHPLAYWILTTDAEDRAHLERAIDKNPALDRMSVLAALAERWPHGVLRGGTSRAKERP